MAQLGAPGLIAIHLTMPQVIPDKLPDKLTPEQQRAVDAQKRFETEEAGYFAIQSSRPQTIGYPLLDSPVGQVAWIYEKFHAWTDNKGNPEDALTRDQMLDNKCGYSDQSAFTRGFRQTVGLTPSEYRRILQGRLSKRGAPA